jgi:hypothetical protein
MRARVAILFAFVACTPFGSNDTTAVDGGSSGSAAIDAGVDSAVPAPVDAGIPAQFEATHTTKTIVVDGKLDDWEGIAPVAFDSKTARHTLGATGDRVSVWAAWTADTLYFACQVDDTTPPTSSESSNPYQNDACEFYVGPAPTGEFVSRDFHFVVDRQNHGQVYIPHAATAPTPNGVKNAAVDSGSRYAIEVAIPSNLVPSLVIGATIAFDIQIDDKNPGLAHPSPYGQDGILWMYWTPNSKPVPSTCDSGENEPACNTWLWGNLVLGQ